MLSSRSVKFFRLHKTRRFAVLTLILGFTLYLWKPVSAKQSHAEFSNWLESFVKNQDDRNLHQKLDKLSRHTGELSEVLDLAAGIINDHNEDFDLPFSNEDSEKPDLKQQLISSWQQQQQQGGMSAALLTDGGKTHSILKNDLIHLKGNSPKDFNGHASDFTEISDAERHQHPFLTLSPLESGIAIGAP